MNKDDKAKLMERIKKLLALGVKHEDTPEGKSALTKARQLMADNNIRFIDIEDGKVSDDNTGKVSVPWRRDNSMEQILAYDIAEALDCRYIITDKGTNMAAHVFIGTVTDMEIAEWLFKFTRLQAYQLSAKTCYSGKDLRTYYFSLYHAIGKKIKYVYGQVDDTPEYDGSTALIVVKKDAVDRRVEQEFPKLEKGRPMKKLAGSMEAFINGQIDGEKVIVNKQVSEEQP